MEEVKAELQQLLRAMYLPRFDKNDLSEENLNKLGKLMYVHNSGHADFDRAVEILKKLGVQQVKGRVYSK
jgi:hypothetical protein